MSIGCSPDAANAGPGGVDEQLISAVHAAIVTRWRGNRPVVCEWTGGRADLAITVAGRLANASAPRFHMDVLCAHPDEVRRVEVEARARAVSGLVAGVLAPGGRDEGGVDVYVAHDLLQAADGERTLGRVALRLSNSAVLVVADRVQPAFGPPPEEVVAVLGRLFPGLPPWYRYDRCAGVVVDDPGLLHRSQSGVMRSPLQILSERFDFESVIGVGGLVDWLLEPPLSVRFGTEVERDYLRAIVELEDRLRAGGAVRPSRFVASLVRRGVAPDPVDALLLLLPGSTAVAPSIIAPEFPPKVEVFAHVIGGDVDAPFLGEGFHTLEADRGTRWTQPTFTLRLPLPTLPGALPCEVVLECVPSERHAGGATFSVNGGDPRRIPDLAETLAARDSCLVLGFTTRGGVLDIEVSLDAPVAAPRADDSRALGLLVRGFSALLAWR